MARRVHAFAEEHLGVLAREGVRSPSVTALENTRKLEIPRLLAEMERRGFRLAAGYGALKSATFRIGHLGDLTVGETEDMLAALAIGHLGDLTVGETEDMLAALAEVIA